MIKLVAFDWNGTILADTFTYKADNEVLRRFGFPEITLKKFQETFEIPVSKYWKAMGFSEKFFKENGEEVNALFTAKYEILADKCRSRSGTKFILSWLKNKKVAAIIYSNHTIPDISRQLHRLKIENDIEKVLARQAGDSSHIHERTKEKKLAAYLKLKGLKPKEVISIGDTEEEIEIGKAFGYHTVAISGGYNSIKRLKKHKPDFLIHNLKELKTIIQKLNK